MECTRMVTFTRVGDREIKVSTSKDSCTCMAYKVLRLPCAHLLSFRIGSQVLLAQIFFQRSFFKFCF